MCIRDSAVCLTVSCLFILKAVLLVKVYRKWPIEFLEFASYLNLFLLTLANFYSLGDQQSQRAVAYTSTSIALALFFSILLYHLLYTMHTKCLKNLTKKMAHRKRLDDVHMTLLTDESNEIETTVVAPTSTTVEISPQHSMQDI